MEKSLNSSLASVRDDSELRMSRHDEKVSSSSCFTGVRLNVEDVMVARKAQLIALVSQLSFEDNCSAFLYCVSAI